MNKQLIERVLSAYDLPWSDILKTEKGYRNESYPVRLSDGQTINLILHKVEPGAVSLIRMADAVSSHAADCGLPTRQILQQKLIVLTSPLTTQYGAVYNYLPGETIPWEAYTMEHMKLLGQSLSSLHWHLKKLPNANQLPSVSNQYFALSEAMEIYFTNSGVQAAMTKKLNLTLKLNTFKYLEKLLYLSSKLDNQQALHMDFVRGNILFSGQKNTLKVSGILDFEKTAYGHPVFDIARTLAFLLVDCKYKEEDKIRKYFLQSGYNKRGPNSFTELSLLEELLNLFLVYDFYKFLLHGPYEFLEQNEHFVRTKQLLLSRGIVDRIDIR